MKCKKKVAATQETHHVQVVELNFLCSYCVPFCFSFESFFHLLSMRKRHPGKYVQSQPSENMGNLYNPVCENISVECLTFHK